MKEGKKEKIEGTSEEKRGFSSSYTRGQRIFAVVAALLLAAMYLLTLVAALTTSKAAPELFKMCLGSTIFLPIMFWLYIRFWKLFTDKTDKTE